MNNSSRLTLVLMAGMPGTGKTSLALAFGQLLKWPVIDKDSLKSPMLTTSIGEELAGSASYALMLEIAYDLLGRQHFSVILDSPGRFPSVLERVNAMADLVGANLKIVHCVASRGLRNRRLSGRVARPSQWNKDAGLSDEQEQQMFAHFPADRLIVDTSLPLNECVTMGLAYLQG